MLGQIEREPPYDELERRGALLEALIEAQVRELGLADRVCYNRAGSISTLFFAPAPVTDFATARRADTKRYAAFFHAMLDRGVFLPPAQFEAWFLSAAHSDADIRRTARSVGDSLAIAFEVSTVEPAVGALT